MLAVVLILVGMGAAFGALLWWSFVLPHTRWEALLIVQTPHGVQFGHKVALKASTRKEARAKALRLGARRFKGCGIQLEELNPC